MKIERPQAESRKINSKDDFELCYLRHQYLRRVDYNPTKQEMEPYIKIVNIQARKTFYAYMPLFKMVGFELVDIESIAHTHLISFLGLYSFQRNPGKLREFVVSQVLKTGKVPSPATQEGKNRANLTMFMKQRMEDVVRVCRQKARNIKGMPTEESYIFFGPKRPPKNPRELVENYEKLGFRKLDVASFKTIRKRVMREKRDANRETNRYSTRVVETIKFAGDYYISVPIEHRDLTMQDFAGAGMDPYDSIHNKNPEQLLFERLNQEDFEAKKAAFDSHSDERKEVIVRHFIRKNRNNPMFKEELALARKFLKELRA